MNKPELISFSEFLMLAPFYDQRQFFAPEIEHMRNGLDALLASGLIQEDKNPLIEYYDKVAVLKIDGPMRPGRDWYFSVGYGDIQDAIDELMDSKAETVIQHMETPGGTVSQAFETEDKFYELAKKKRLVSAIAMATSAGALLTFPAKERYLLGKTAETGSIGVIATHVDNRIWYKDFMGEVRTTVAKGEYKDAGTDTRAYDEKAKLIFEETVSKLHSIFIDSAAKGLGKSPDEITAQQSKVYIGQDGIDAGFAQGFSTLNQLIEKYNTSTTFFSTPGRPAFSNIQQEANSMDINKLKAEFPDVYQAVIDEGKKLGLEASKETHYSEGKAAGALEERKRMSAIDALALPGQEKLATELKKNGTSEGEAAVKFLAAQKETLVKMKTGIESDLEDPVVTDVPAPPKKPEGEQVINPVDEYKAEVAKLIGDGKTEGQAMKIVKTSKPELHQNYIDAVNKRG